MYMGLCQVEMGLVIGKLKQLDYKASTPRFRKESTPPTQTVHLNATNMATEQTISWGQTEATQSTQAQFTFG